MSDIVERLRNEQPITQDMESTGLGDLMDKAADEIERLRKGPKVKALEWEDYPINGDPVVSMAITPLGTYFICDDTDDFTGLYCEFVTHKNATWYGTVTADHDLVIDHQHLDGHAPLQAAAQADYERRIRAALEDV